MSTMQFVAWGKDSRRGGGWQRAHFALLRRLQSLQSIWQLEGMVRPPSRHGVMWSASISDNSKCALHRGQTPCWRFSLGATTMKFVARWGAFSWKWSIRTSPSVMHDAVIFVGKPCAHGK